MKRKLTLFSLAAALVAVLTCGLLFGCTKARTGEATKQTSVYANDNGYVRILQLTDLHLTKGKSKKEDKQTLKWVEEAVRFARPQVVAVTGDAVGSLYGRDTALIQLAELFETLEVNWMYTFGNHDGEWSSATKEDCGKVNGLEGRQELFDILKAYPHCMMQKGDTDGIGNYVIDVLDKETNKTVHAFVNMDTHGKLYVDGKDTGYLGLTENQVGWYEREINAVKGRTADGEIPPSTLFLHVPLFEYIEAYNTLPHVGGFEEQNLEGYPCAPATDVGMFQKIKELGSTKMVTAGHDHDFNWLREYQDVYLMYGRVSGVNAWGRRTPVGATVIDLNVKADKNDLGAMYKMTTIYPSFEYSRYEGWTF